MTTGEKIAKCRKEKNLTQANLAGVLGVTRQAVSRWESDLAFPETDNLTKMSKLFGVTVDWLLNYDSEAPQNIPESGLPAGNRFTSLKRYYLEYKSKAHIGSLPLVHINIGIGRRAKGVISVGFISTGIISIGLVSAGVISFGLLSFGLLALGLGSAGIFSAGTVALGIIALGAIAIGFYAMGAISIGLFAVGAVSFGYFIAIGDIARGGIALGNQSAVGNVYSATVPQFDELKAEIYSHFNNVPKIFSMFTFWCRSLFNGILNGYITLGG